MNILKALVLLAAVFCLIEAGRFFAVAAGAAADTRILVVETQKRLVSTDQNINALLLQLGLVADNVRRATDAQKSATTQTLAILLHTDRLLTDAQKSVDQITTHSVRAMDDLKAPLADLDTTLRSLNTVVADQNIPKALANLEETSRQTSIAAAHVEQTTDDVSKIAHHYEQEIIKPASLVKRLSGYVLTGLKAILIFK